MIDSIFIAVLFVAVVFQILSVREHSIIFAVFTTMFWLVLMLECLAIQWPYYSQVYNVSANMTVTSEGFVYFSHPGLGALFLGFVFINIVFIIVEFFDFQQQKNK